MNSLKSPRKKIDAGKKKVESGKSSISQGSEQLNSAINQTMDQQKKLLQDGTGSEKTTRRVKKQKLLWNRSRPVFRPL